MSNRMKAEYDFFLKYKSDDESGGPIDSKNMFEWKINFNGPRGSDYENGKFHVKITFPNDYPKSMPSCKFLNDELLHPNINSKGEVCFGNYVWKEEYNILDYLSAISYLLENPYFDSGYDNKQIKEFFESDPESYHQTVRELVAEYSKY